MNKIRKHLSGLRIKLFGERRSLVREEFLGRELLVYKNTIRRGKVGGDDAWFYRLAKESIIIFDVGAHVGHTAMLANLGGNPSNIVLIDSNPLALTFAAGNLINNNMAHNCHFIVAFISDRLSEKVKFFTVGSDAAGSMYPLHASVASRLNSWYWVETETLDHIVDRLRLVPDLVKVDVEGAETLVLRGATKLVNRGSPRWIVEVHSRGEMNVENNASEILKWCEENQYSCWYMAEELLLVSPHPVRKRGRCHFLLIKKGLPYPEELKGIREGSEILV